MDRDIAVLIEVGYQFSGRVDCYPDMGIDWTELIDASPEVFLEELKSWKNLLKSLENGTLQEIL